MLFTYMGKTSGILLQILGLVGIRNIGTHQQPPESRNKFTKNMKKKFQQCSTSLGDVMK